MVPRSLGTVTKTVNVTWKVGGADGSRRLDQEGVSGMGSEDLVESEIRGPGRDETASRATTIVTHLEAGAESSATVDDRRGRLLVSARFPNPMRAALAVGVAVALPLPGSPTAGGAS
jgi:hypothetical protein